MNWFVQYSNNLTYHSLCRSSLLLFLNSRACQALPNNTHQWLCNKIHLYQPVFSASSIRSSPFWKNSSSPLLIAEKCKPLPDNTWALIFDRSLGTQDLKCLHFEFSKTVFSQFENEVFLVTQLSVSLLYSRVNNCLCITPRVAISLLATPTTEPVWVYC